jgi:hypothetical protein
MTEELEQLLKNLQLRRILEIYDEQLRSADKDDIRYSEFVTRLVRAQWQARQEGALEWRIRRANLPERWTLETFPFARQPGVNRKHPERTRSRGFALSRNARRVDEGWRRQSRCCLYLIDVALRSWSSSPRPKTSSWLVRPVEAKQD